MRYKKLFMYLVVIICFLSGCSKNTSNIENSIENQTNNETTVNYVKTGNVKIDSIEEKYYTVSRIEPLDTINVMSTVEGTVNEVFIKQGDKVKKGQVLYTLIYDENIRNAKLNYESTAEEMSLSNIIYKEGKAQYDKMVEFNKSGSITDYELTKAKIELEQSKTQLNMATKANENALEVYNLLKERYEVKSPLEGYVSYMNIKAGENVSYNQVIRINRDGKKIVQVGVPEKHINRINKDTTSRIKVDSTGKMHNGNVVEISTEIDRSTGLYPVKVEVIAENDIKDGLFAEVEIILNTLDNQLMIPNKSIIYEENQTYVFIVGEKNYAQKVKVETEIKKEHLVQVIKGISETDLIIIEGQHYLEDNSVIEVIN